MTDAHDYTAAETPATVVDAPEEANPMLASLQSFMNSAKEFTTLSKRVKSLEDQVRSLSDQLSRTTTERDSLRAENGNLKDEVRILRDDSEHDKATIERYRKQNTDWMKRFDDEHNAHNRTSEALENAKDERDYNALDRDEWKRKHEQVEKEFSDTTHELADARQLWYDQESKLQERIDALSVERDRFRDKFDRCKSLAAQVMAMDQQRD